MVESIMAFPAETAGSATSRSPPRCWPTARSGSSSRRRSSTGRCARQGRPGVGVQRHGARTAIELDVGDKVEVEITNELPIGTDIHWHGIDIPFDQDGVAPITQDLVATGETYTYEFTVTEPAIGMYHAHAHGHEAVPNGLFGTSRSATSPSPPGRPCRASRSPPTWRSPRTSRWCSTTPA